MAFSLLPAFWPPSSATTSEQVQVGNKTIKIWSHPSLIMNTLFSAWNTLSLSLPILVFCSDLPLWFHTFLKLSLKGSIFNLIALICKLPRFGQFTRFWARITYKQCIWNLNIQGPKNEWCGRLTERLFIHSPPPPSLPVSDKIFLRTFGIRSHREGQALMEREALETHSQLPNQAVLHSGSPSLESNDTIGFFWHPEMLWILGTRKQSSKPPPTQCQKHNCIILTNTILGMAE